MKKKKKLEEEIEIEAWGRRRKKTKKKKPEEARRRSRKKKKDNEQTFNNPRGVWYDSGFVSLSLTFAFWHFDTVSGNIHHPVSGGQAQLESARPDGTDHLMCKRERQKLQQLNYDRDKNLSVIQHQKSHFICHILRWHNIYSFNI